MGSMAESAARLDAVLVPLVSSPLRLAGQVRVELAATNTTRDRIRPAQDVVRQQSRLAGLGTPPPRTGQDGSVVDRASLWKGGGLTF